MIKKMFLTAFVAVLVVPMMNVSEKAYGMDLQYSDLTETQPFYRVTKGFEDHSMAELDNNPDTKIEFIKGTGLTNVDYIFPKNTKVKEIRFKTDTPQYQRVLVMRGSLIHWQSDFYKFENGVIILPSEIQADTIRIQFNGGSDGVKHNLSDIEVIGYGTATNSWGLPQNLPALTMPGQIAELIQKSNSAPVVEEVPVMDEAEIEMPIIEAEKVPFVEEESIIEDVPALIETNDPMMEDIFEEDFVSEPMADEPVIDGTEEVTEQPSIPEVPVSDEPIGSEPIEEVLSIIEKEEEKQVELPRTDLIQGNEQALNSSVFSVSKTYAVYKANSASLKLLNYKQYDESYLLNKLSHSLIRVDGVLVSAEAFIELLHTKK